MTIFCYEWPRAFAGKTKGEFHPAMKLPWERAVHSDHAHKMFSSLKKLTLLKLRF